jgi:hypothetical protein
MKKMINQTYHLWSEARNSVQEAFGLGDTENEHNYQQQGKCCSWTFKVLKYEPYMSATDRARTLCSGNIQNVRKIRNQ